MIAIRVGTATLAVVACKSSAPPPPVDIPPDKPGLLWIAPAGEGGEEDGAVAIDASGTVLYAGRLRESQKVQGVGRPSRAKENRDALYVAGRDVAARKGWVRTATASASYPRPAGLAALGSGRVALAVQEAEALDWGEGPSNRPSPARDAGHLEQFRAKSDRVGRLDFGVYVVGANDAAIATAMFGDATHVVSDGSGAFVLAGTGWSHELSSAWRNADADACAEGVESVDILRWRDVATPDWVACLTTPDESRVGDLAVAADGDIVACIDVKTVTKKTDDEDDDEDDGEETWSAHLYRIDGATGNTRWSVPVPAQDGESRCDGLATTSGGHVVLGRGRRGGIVVFDGKQAPSFDTARAMTIDGHMFARGLGPTTIVVVSSNEVRELDVVTGAIAWSYRLPDVVDPDAIAAGAGMVAIAGSYGEAFDGGAAGKLPDVDERDLDGFVLVVRAPIAPGQNSPAK
jgi:hypothetical protein